MSTPLRIKFRCSNCERSLSIGRRKAGTKVTCPQCQTRITVPASEDSAASNDETPTPFSEFQVYDDEYDEPELIYDDQFDGQRGDHKLNMRLSIPRRMVYAQGALLGIVAIVFFLLGLLIGSAGQNQRSRTTDSSVVRGTVLLPNEVADEGAVVFLLPTKNRPDSRFEAEELRPGRIFTSANPEVPLIRRFGGNVCTTNRAGQFEMTVKPNQEYILLVVSANLPRRVELDSDFHSDVGHYFTSLDILTEGQSCFYKKVLPMAGRENFGEIRPGSDG